jgi:hypothetical protein
MSEKYISNQTIRRLIMNRKKTILLTVSLAGAAIIAALLWTLNTAQAAPQAAAPPIAPSISYQGRLTTPSGTPVEDGVYTMTFSIYNDPTTGSPLWTQTSTVTVTNGLFDVALGSITNPINATVFPGGPRWLGVQVDPDPEMTPRQPFDSVPYAITTENLRSGGATSDTSSGALYTFANNGSGPALVANGDVRVDGDLTWYTRTSHISISPAAFQPYNDTYQYVRKGRSLYTTSGKHYYAPLQLPDGATIDSLNFCYRDDATTTGVVTMTLRRGYAAGDDSSYDIMAEIGSYDVGYQCNVEFTIDYPTVDNAHYIYWLHAEFDGSLDEYRRVMAVTIKYEYTEPY